MVLAVPLALKNLLCTVVLSCFFNSTIFLVHFCYSLSFSRKVRKKAAAQ